MLKPVDADPQSVVPAMDCFRGGGEMGALMRATDWARTPVGDVASWSPSFRSMVGLVLRNGFPLCMWWGPELVQFYNDPFRPTLGAKHPTACGQSGRECWAEIWHIIGPMIEGPFAGGPAAGAGELPLLIHRNGFFEETHFRVAYSPIPDESVVGTGIGGVLATVSETTAQVIAERQVRTLRELGLHAARSSPLTKPARTPRLRWPTILQMYPSRCATCSTTAQCPDWRRGLGFLPTTGQPATWAHCSHLQRPSRNAASTSSSVAIRASDCCPWRHGPNHPGTPSLSR